jgi:hypothetical protein
MEDRNRTARASTLLNLLRYSHRRTNRVLRAFGRFAPEDFAALLVPRALWARHEGSPARAK